MYNPQNNTFGFAVVSTEGLFDGTAASPTAFGRGSGTTPNWFFHEAVGNIGLLDIYAIAKACAATLVYPAGEQISPDFFPSYVQAYRGTKNILTPFLLHRIIIQDVAAGTPTAVLQKEVSGVDQGGGITSISLTPIASFPLAAITTPVFISDYACRIVTPGDILVIDSSGAAAAPISILVELMPLDTGEAFVRACCSCPVEPIA
jgi:hypothetical protein